MQPAGHHSPPRLKQELLASKPQTINNIFPVNGGPDPILDPLQIR